uniref:Uncharacterized protein n=1 Tax=Coccolithus braarudii TaxID=221442 RepID=A0A7S0Q0X7_9EUKA|mmetsp:Transcript_24658/g.53191  ORF Transcript_24658/g.53191 Transcript_24658/m.53191 type:complete len:358 (+) Transcript_24658:31-1104(+)
MLLFFAIVSLVSVSAAVPPGVCLDCDCEDECSGPIGSGPGQKCEDHIGTVCEIDGFGVPNPKCANDVGCGGCFNCYFPGHATYSPRYYWPNGAPTLANTAWNAGLPWNPQKQGTINRNAGADRRGAGAEHRHKQAEEASRKALERQCKHHPSDPQCVRLFVEVGEGPCADSDGNMPESWFYVRNMDGVWPGYKFNHCSVEEAEKFCVGLEEFPAAKVEGARCLGYEALDMEIYLQHEGPDLLEIYDCPPQTRVLIGAFIIGIATGPEGPAPISGTRTLGDFPEGLKCFKALSPNGSLLPMPTGESRTSRHSVTDNEFLAVLLKIASKPNWAGPDEDEFGDEGNRQQDAGSFVGVKKG